MENKGVMYYIRIGGVLLLISAVIAVMLAFVNAATVDRIAENELKRTMEAIEGIFPDADGVSELDGDFGETVGTVYEIRSGADFAGYCVTVSPKGFKDAVVMMVGILPDGSVAGVRVTTHSETPGLGSKVCEESYLDRYIGKGTSGSVNGEVDAITGATITSKAVMAGINTALAIDFGAAEGAAE